MSKISLIIPNLNGAEFLPSCLQSLLVAISHCPNSKFEFILVDNASTDDSLDIFNFYTQGLFSKIIINQKNLGFAAAVNQGITAAKYPLVCLINNDLTLKPLWFKRVFKSIKKSPQNTAAFCGTILNKAGTSTESQGISFDFSGKCIQNINYKLKTKNCYVWGASGALVVYRKNILQKIGLFDTSFFAYIEDVDLAFRLHKLGYKTRLIPKAISYHLGGGTSNKQGNLRQYYTFRNWQLLIIKNYSFLQILKNLFPIIEERLRNFSYLAKNTPFPKIIFDTFKIYLEIILLLPKIC